MIKRALYLLATASLALAAAPSSGTWTNKTSMPTGRSEAGVAALGEKIYAIGGGERDAGGKNNPATSLNMVYDTRKDSWTKLAPLPLGLSHVGVAALGGKVYAVGGFTGSVHMNPQAVAFVYNPASDRWSQLPTISSPRGSVAVAATAGKLHIFGGRLSNKVSKVPLPPGSPDVFQGYGTVTTHQVYDPATGQWTEGAPLPGSGRDHMGIAVLEGKIHIFGGRLADDTDNLDRHDVYDPATDTWSTAAPLPVARSAGAASVLDGRIIYAGGECKRGSQQPMVGEPYDDVTAYDPRTDSWSRLASMPKAHVAFGAATVNGAAYFVGGITACGGGAPTADLLALTLR